MKRAERSSRSCGCVGFSPCVPKSLGVPKRDVELLRGESSRRKQVAIAVSPEVAARWLAELLQASA